MLTHNDIWQALDKLAYSHNISPSAMARMAGLDPTIFNKSKRFSPDGKPRWPSSESIAKVLSALGVGFSDFATLAEQNDNLSSSGIGVPLIFLHEAEEESFLDSKGRILLGKRDAIKIPGVSDQNIFALQISGNDYKPILRDGDRIIISPAANIRRGDRVLIKPKKLNMILAELDSISAARIGFFDLKNGQAQNKQKTMSLPEIKWVSRIVWISQ